MVRLLLRAGFHVPDMAGYVHLERDFATARREDVEQILKAEERAAFLTHKLLAFSRQKVVKERRISPLTDSVSQRSRGSSPSNS